MQFYACKYISNFIFARYFTVTAPGDYSYYSYYLYRQAQDNFSSFYHESRRLKKCLEDLMKHDVEEVKHFASVMLENFVVFYFFILFLVEKMHTSYMSIEVMLCSGLFDDVYHNSGFKPSFVQSFEMILASSCPVGYGNADLLILFHCYACCCYFSTNFLDFISLLYHFLIIINIIKGASKQIPQGEEVLE